MEASPRVALVTGGTGRVGSAIAARLEQEGFAVRAAGRADGDLRHAGAAQALVWTTVEEFGALDLVVHAASEGFSPRPVAEVSEEDWDTAFGATTKGAFFVAKEAAPQLAQSELGLIVMIEDVAAFEPWPGYAPHSAAKAAQAMLTRVLARALAPDVRVCGIAPGPVAVEPEEVDRRASETLLDRVGSPDDVAEAVTYLTAADFVTGTSLVVDGGALLAR